jgi:basic amino acid/polyamine antiporter, APA family
VNGRTQTPIRASVLVTGLAMLVATLFPIERLATVTSLITLVIFSAVNLCLLAIKQRNEPAPAGVFTVPLWVPAVGALTCLMLVLVGATR